VLLTSFRPSALTKLGLDAATLHARYPRLCLVRIVGASGAHAEEAGHDLTYLAQSGLVTSTELPATLYADMGGSLMASEPCCRPCWHARAAAKGLIWKWPWQTRPTGWRCRATGN